MTTLADYRVNDSVNVDGLIDPFAGRLHKFLDLYGGRVLIVSGWRSYAEQEALWNQNPNPAQVAPPGTSNHERGSAADLRIVDSVTSWSDVHWTAAAYGLRFPLWNEDWHCEPDPVFVDPPEEPADMTPQEMAHLLGCTLDGYGRAVVPVGQSMYPIANVVAFILDEIQRDDLLVTRIKAKLES